MLKKITIVELGTFIMAFGIYNFYYQNGITEGGVLGIFLILKNVFDIEISLANIIIDGLLLLLGFKFYGKKFLGLTLLSTSTFSIFTAIFEKIGFVMTINNNIIAAILGGLCVGIGCGLIINTGAAGGGDDIVALIVSKFSKFRISTVYLITDISILFLSLTYLPINKMIYSILAVIVSGQIVGFLYKFNHSETSIDYDIKNEELAKIAA
ncbi:YitT family protein [Peptostreptococcus equinus]|uniref:YitT family protein n=1 Tax=Peptostreptococcus equinus TaxID=3003601 RepID=A0ABY7JR49_9FIRM|nr:YitT family protein [Peptostreptococcus sp. CBA3647]WAW15823.1 YitT family protein [Peptostreptococcus sp. CBA3647]